MGDLVIEPFSGSSKNRISQRTPSVEAAVDVQKYFGTESTRHRDLLSGEFWRKLPAFSDIDEATFYDHHWQVQNSIFRIEKMIELLQDTVDQEFINDIAMGFRKAPMSVRLTPYLFSLIDWENPASDPIRRQFIPLRSEMLPDHPKLKFDSLNEQSDSPVPGLTHRYRDKALFLALDTCPVYCRFCTRSYAVGINTETNEKINLRATNQRWRDVFNYISSHDEIEDIVVSGGDTYQLRPAQITEIGETLLAMPNIRRIRFATKGPLALPQKIITDSAWREALVRVVEKGRAQHKEVVVHTHFNHPNEITSITQAAVNMLMERGVIVRNQSVLQRGVNDSVQTMQLLVKRLSYINITPYYVYVHDLVKGVEDLRVPVQRAIDIEKHVRGTTAGFNTPVFVIDAPGGGGKRDVHSYEYYNRETGVSVYISPSVKKDAHYLYFDPLHCLRQEIREMWQNPQHQQALIDEAVRYLQN